MKNSRDWDNLLAPGAPWQEAYPQLAEDVRAFLIERDGQTFPTKYLRMVLYPLPRNEQAHQRFYRALKALSTRELADCCSKADKPVKRYGHDAYPLKWHAPDPSRTVSPAPQALRSPEHAFVARVASMASIPPDVIDWQELVAEAKKLAAA